VASKFTIDENVYASMLGYLEDLSGSETAAENRDIAFIQDDFWLQDTAVIDNIEKRNGEWCIYLVFAHHLLPLKFIKRKIVHYVCPKRAGVAAHYMRRQAAKDQRGTLTVNKDLLIRNFN